MWHTHPEQHKFGLVCFYFYSCGGVRLSSLGTLDTSGLTVPALDDDDDNDHVCGAADWMNCTGNLRNQKSRPGVILSNTIPHSLTWDCVQAAGN
jgi:hypothetical protein